MEWRIEFNIEQQNFHLENINKPSPIQAYTNGWFTIYDNLNDVKSFLFCEYVDKKKKNTKITKSDIFKYKSEFDSIISVMENVGYLFNEFPSKNQITNELRKQINQEITIAENGNGYGDGFKYVPFFGKFLIKYDESEKVLEKQFHFILDALIFYNSIATDKAFWNYTKLPELIDCQ